MIGIFQKISKFVKEITNRVVDVESIEDLKKRLCLATNIWNNTPRYGRGGKSPVEIHQEYDTESLIF